MNPQACAHEIVNRALLPSNKARSTKKGKKKKARQLVETVKPMVDSLLARGGDYVLFTNRRLPPGSMKLRIEAIRKKLISLRKPYAKSARIRMYAADRIRTWVNCYLPAIVYVQGVTGFPVVPGLKTWNEWHETFPQRSPYYPDAPTKELIATIRNELQKPGTALRLVGLSGLGKTRLALEALAPTSDTDPVAAAVVYFDVAHNESALRNEVSEWRRFGLGGVLVVDNCPAELHKTLQSEIATQQSRLSLLTLDLNPNEQLRETTTLRLKPSDSPHITDVVKKVLPGAPEDDAKKIAALSSGFVYYALLLCETWKENETIERALPDSQELVRMLWGAKQGAESALRAIEACALFESADVGDGTSDEAKFVATIAGLDARTFSAHLSTFQDRELIERYGSYLRVRPHPLALRLCMDWWRRCSASQASELFASVPESMVTPLCDRLRMLNFLSQAKLLTEKLCGAQGPFGQAEVLSSGRGARIFRALVELNPEACIGALSSVVTQYDYDALRTLEAPRREWVWGLERLVYHRETYVEAADVLARLAVSESEKYANNATGILLQTFHVQLPGTEATLETRGKYLSALFDSEDSRFVEIALRGADSAFTTEYFTRTSGAEDQGFGPSLKEYQPKTLLEITSYWRLIIDSIIKAVESHRVSSDQALNVFASHLRGFVRIGQLELADYIIQGVKGWITGVWESGLNALGDISRYEAAAWPHEQKSKLKAWIDSLSPDVGDIPSRLVIAINRPSWSDFLEEGADGKSSPAEQAATLMAEECARDFPLWRPHLHSVFVGEQRMGFAFGYRLGEVVHDPEPLTDIALSTLGENPEAGNPVVLQAFLKAVGRRDTDLVRRTIDTLLTNPKLHRYAPMILTGLQPPLASLLRLVGLVRDGALPSRTLRSFAYGQAMGHLSPDDAIVFAKAIYELDNDSAWTALELLYMYCFGESKERWPKVRSTTRKFHMSGKLMLANHANTHDVHIWKETVLKLLEMDDPDLAKQLTSQLIADSEAGAHSFEIPADVAQKLFERYGRVVWPIFGAQLVKKPSRATWTLSHYIGRGLRGSSEKAGGPIDALNEEVLKEWLAQNPSAAAIVATMIRPLKQQGDAYAWTPLARLLIDRYGHDKSVLGSLSANLHTGTWWGSRAPHYTKIKTLSLTLLSHSKATVRAWAVRLGRDMDHWLQQEQREADARNVGRW